MSRVIKDTGGTFGPFPATKVHRSDDYGVTGERRSHSATPAKSRLSMNGLFRQRWHATRTARPPFTGGVMRQLRRSVYPLAIALWLALVPGRAQAAIITPLAGTLTAGTEIESLHAFTLTGPGELTLLLSTDFFAVATLFGPIVLGADGNALPGEAIYLNKYHFLEDDTDFTTAGLFQAFPLTRPGDYLLTLTQVDNYFNDNAPGGFERSGIYFETEFGCRFLDEFGCTDLEVGTYAGSLSLQTVPEPATVSLAVIGASALLSRRRVWQRHGNFRTRPSS